VVIDVRSPQEYAAGHLPGAENIPADELERHLAEIPSDKPVVVYWNMQHPGRSRSERVAQELRERGYHAEALVGGLPAWRDAGYPVAKGDWRRAVARIERRGEGPFGDCGRRITAT
jgi:rhodanese-related sulfurtransferase